MEERLIELTVCDNVQCWINVVDAVEIQTTVLVTSMAGNDLFYFDT